MISNDRMDELRSALRADAAVVAEKLLGTPNKERSTRKVLRWGTKGGLAVAIQGPDQGTWFDHSEPTNKGDMLRLTQHTLGCDFRGAVDWAARQVGVTINGSDGHDALSEKQREQQEADRRARRAEQAAKEAAETAADEARRVRGAQGTAAASGPVNASLGDHYLQNTRGIPKPACAWPDSFRFHAKMRAVIAVATTADGTVRAVQHIYLSEVGKKVDEAEIEQRGLKNAKVTHGVLDGAVVRLPGDPAGPLLLAEGVETGAATWSSTHHETWICLGSVARVDPPVDRLVLILSDDNPAVSDAKRGGAERTLQRALVRWREAGHRVVVALPWETRRGDGSDMADLILEQGAGAVAARIQAAEMGMNESAGPDIRGLHVEEMSHAEHAVDDAQPAPETDADDSVADTGGVAAEHRCEPEAAASGSEQDASNVTPLALEKAFRLSDLDFAAQKATLAESLKISTADLAALRRKHEAKVRDAEKARERAEASRDKEEKARQAKETAEAKANEKKATHAQADTDRSAVAKEVSHLNSEYAVVNEGGRAFIYQRGKDAVLKRRVFHRLSPSDFKIFHMNKKIEVGVDAEGNPKMRSVGSVWLSHPDRRQFIKGVTFDPTNQTQPGELNLWEGFGTEPAPGDWSLLKDHIKTVVCSGNQKHCDYLLNWLARMVQFPAQQGEVAVVLKGEEGCGKGTLAGAIKAMIGHHALAINNAKHLVGNFNAHLRDVVFLFADEAFFAGDKQHVGVLKSLITESSLTIEGKYANAVEFPNYLHVFMASNEEWVVPADLRSRRFFVLNVPDDRVGDYPYFDAIRRQLDAGGHAAMLHELLNRDISNFNVRDVPQTKGLEQQRQLSLNTTHAWWYDCLERGYVFKSKLGLEAVFGVWSEHFTTELLHKSYTEFANARNERRQVNRVQLGKFFTDLGGTVVRPRNAIVGEHLVDKEDAGGRIVRRADVVTVTQKSGYSFGNLDAARKAFVEKTRISVPWDNDTADSDAAAVVPSDAAAAAPTPDPDVTDDEWLTTVT